MNYDVVEYSSPVSKTGEASPTEIKGGVVMY